MADRDRIRAACDRAIEAMRLSRIPDEAPQDADGRWLELSFLILEAQRGLDEDRRAGRKRPPIMIETSPLPGPAWGKEVFPRRSFSNPLEPGLPVPVVGTGDTVILMPVVEGPPVGVTHRPGLIVDAGERE